MTKDIIRILTMVAYKIIVKGRVQGVGYRWFAVRQAEQLQVQGSVKNLYNGQVQVIVQGDSTAVNEYIALLRQGPAYAHVTDLEVQDIDVDHNLNKFTVDY